MRENRRFQSIVGVATNGAINSGSSIGGQPRMPLFPVGRKATDSHLPASQCVS